MQSYGNINFNSNQAQQLALQVEYEFPATPVVGRILFKDKRVFICVEILGGLPVWIPLTNEIDTYVHRVPVANAATTWTVPHNLNTPYPIVQVYDINHNMMLPDNVIAIDNNTVEVTFATAAAGVAVAMHGNSLLGTEKMQYVYEHIQRNVSTVWVINHDLGYYPIVRVFIGNEEVQPDSITHNTVFTTTITFTAPQVGVARLV
jgi:hypothetical protein